MPPQPPPLPHTPALFSEEIAGLNDWQGETLGRVRALILAAAPGIQEEWTWDTPVGSCGGILCTGEVYKAAVKLTFPQGAALPDPGGLFNVSLEGKMRRAIDLCEGATLDEPAFQALVRAAAALNEEECTPKQG